MSALSEALGVGHELTVGGKVYHFSLITQDIKVSFERKLFARAKELAKNYRELMDKDEYATHLLKLGDEYQAGEYALESKKGANWLKTVPGMSMLVGLL